MRWILPVLGLTLAASLWTYQTSLNRREAQIAVSNTANFNPNPTTVSFTQAGQVRVYAFKVTVAWPPISLKLSSGGQTADIASLKMGEFKDTGLTVATGSALQATVFDHANFKPQAYGWKAPVGTKCGITNNNISASIQQVEANGQPLVSTQCWADTDSATEKDFDDYLLIFSYTPEATPSASPSPVVSPSPQPSSSPEPSDEPVASASPLASPNPSPSPAAQPDTGTPTTLTLIAGILFAGGLLLKLHYAPKY